MKDRIVTEIAPLPKPATFKDTTKVTMRVAAYARVSTDHEDQQSSLVAQTEYYKKLIAERPGWQFVQVYVDEGISGLRTERREGFKHMIEDCLAGSIDLVLTKSISRFARNTVDSVSTIRKLKEKGIAVYFEKENIYTMDSKGEFLLTIMSSLAQEESRSISENVTWGQRKRLADGKTSLAYSRFLGYDKGKEKYEMVVNEDQAVTVRRIFFMFLQGYTAHSISKILTDEGVPTPCGCDVWYAKTIQSILQNEKYKGDALLQKQFTVDFLTKKLKKNEGELPQYYVKEDHEPIISPWLFDYVQKRLKERGNCPGRYSGVTVLSSKLRCGVCCSMYTPRPWHSTSYNNLVWQCRNRTKKGPKCRTHNIYDKLLHYAIHDFARTAAYKRGVSQTVMNIVQSVVGDDKAEAVCGWISHFEKKDVRKMLSDEDDLAMVIQCITVMPDRTLKILWLDGKKSTYHLPKFTPSRGVINHYDK